jgi:hypothetical protein
MSMPVPAADPSAYERMAKEQKLEQAEHSSSGSGPVSFLHDASLLKTPMSLFNSRPNVSAAAHTGVPNLNPPSDAISARDVLRPDAPGPEFNLAAQNPAATSDSPAASGGGSQADLSQGGGSDFSGTGVGAQIISTGAPSDTEPQAVTGSSDPPAANMSPNVHAIPTMQAVTGSDATAPAATNAPQPSTAAAPASSSPAPAASGSSTPAPAATGANAPASGSSDSGSSSSESTSKKKKGLHKLIPF